MSNSLSVVIITKNEENFIADAINSAQFADDVLIVDSYSEDKTREIAKKLGARVISQKWLGFGSQKNKAIELALNNWVFVLDSDERITLELKNEIIEKLTDPLFDAYHVPRLNYFFGKKIKTCGLYPDHSIRLFNRVYGKFNNVPVHESVILNSVNVPVGRLENHMIHLAYDNVEEFIEKQKKYARLSSKKKNLAKALISPLWAFTRRYFFKFGFFK